MEISKQFLEETVIFMRKQKVASFEISPEGVMKVSFDPRFADTSGDEVTAETVKQTIQDLVTNGEKKMMEEEEQFLYGSV